MSGYTVYFDSGTSNSRIYLLNETFEVLYSDAKHVGSRDTSITGSNEVLIDGLKEIYDRCLYNTGVQEADVREIYASGMVTSPYGLYEVPHCEIPVSVETFSGHLVRYYEERRFHREIYLIPGLKTTGNDIRFVNNMRGEEIEIIGVMDNLARMFPDGRDTALIFPGSHTHTVLIERCSNMTDILSQMTGELFYGIKEDTILSSVLNYPVNAQTLDEDQVLEGKKNLDRFGFNRAIYICHAMRLFDKGSPEQRVSYAEGVINGDYANALNWYCENRWKNCNTAVVASDELMYKILRTVLSDSPYIKDVHWIPIQQEKPFSVQGLKKILAVKHMKQLRQEI